MRLELTLVAAPAGPQIQATELSVDAPGGAPGRTVAEGLSFRWPGVLFSIAGILVEQLIVGTAPLISGAVVVAGTTPPVHRRSPIPALVLAVQSGPDAGAVFPLQRGRYRIGRGWVEINIGDPCLSRHCADLVIGARCVTVTAAGSSHPVEVDGLAAPKQTLAVGQILRVGSSTATLMFLPVLPPGLKASCGPSEGFAGSSGAAGSGSAAPAGLAGSAAVPPLLIRFPRSSSRGAWTAVAVSGLSLLLGTCLAILTGQWMYMAFSAMSVVAAAVPLAGGRKRRRKFRTDLANAVLSDGERRRSAAPSAADLYLKTGSGMRFDKRCAADDGGFRLRMGTARQRANISLEPFDPEFEPPLLPDMPVLVESEQVPELLVSGPIHAVDGLLRFLLMQLDAACVPTVVTGSPQRLPLAARFLPLVGLTTRPDVSTDPLGQDPLPVMISIDDEDNFTAVGTRHGTSSAGSGPGLPLPAGSAFRMLIRCRTSPDAPAPPGDRTVLLAVKNGRLVGSYAGLEFVPDLVSTRTFERYVRIRSVAQPGGRAARARPAPGLVPAPGLGPAPGDYILADPANLSAEAITADWQRFAAAPLRPVPIGVTGAGVEVSAQASLLLDLDRDGPHLLVAGTTGSGKTELLRTLVVALALHHPPCLVSFLFIDFKGGSGLAPLAGLPHCFALVTDLSGSAMDRVLASLNAEVHKREDLLSRAASRDLASYVLTRPSGFEPIPRLVIVIDEFRVLMDEVPQALTDLMHIAAVGRSLGIHLIMATQRPQGAISADIRANVTSSICLRVKSSFESLDVIDSPLAARIPVALPGRAYFQGGNDVPVEFQAATLEQFRCSPRAEAGGSALITPTLTAVSENSTPQRSAAPVSMSVPVPADPATELVALLCSVQAEVRLPLPPSPVAPELPSVLDAADMAAWPSTHGGSEAGSAAGRTDAVPLGLLDVPERQRVVPLVWSPVDQSHLALIGPPGRGASTAAALAAAGLLARDVPGDALYCLDGDGSLLGFRNNPAVGAYLLPEDMRAVVRLLQRFSQELGGRTRHTGYGVGGAEVGGAEVGGAEVGGAEVGGAEVGGAGRAPAQRPPLLGLAVTAWGRWLSTIRSGPWPWAEDLLADIIRDGKNADAVAIISGDRELVTARFVASIPNRLYFPCGASAEAMSAWPRLPRIEPVTDRACALGPIAEADAGGPALGHLAQMIRLGSHPAPRPEASVQPALRLPFRVRALPGYVSIQDAVRAGTGPGAEDLLLGLGGDGHSPVSVRLSPGAVLLAIGAPGSGKTNLLTALRRLNPDRKGWLGPRSSAAADSAAVDADYWRDCWGRRHDREEGFAGTTLCADDIDRLSAAELEALTFLQGAGALIVATAGNNPAALGRLPLTAWGRNSGTGLVLAPRRSQDGDFFGVRLEVWGQSPPPGRAVLMVNGGMEWLQLAHAAP
ncbi:hypothetical protein IV498_06220 [Paenarthrobacter sp. Z7-10]|uniref:FtsK/SpoIIIE domain-containing protein n=1 Tax=Paenarthrobacter sp. Z7-10 TaxID=2787635 RepID=UPI0022A9D2DC|nr:FtsK/SpoIIIE domain-containing protein [Paenarthrobacter sp. Z7-10]MCZ2402792.1 hypothetical protein [Paenarthrobacter sp. Z7-10]